MTINAQKKIKSIKKISPIKFTNKILSNSVVKQYGLIDNKSTKYLSNWYDIGLIKQITFSSFTSIIENTRLFAISFEVVESYLKFLREGAPIDVRLIVDGIEITDHAEKSAFLDDIIIVEQQSESKITLIPLTDEAIKTTKLEAAAKTQVQQLVSSLQRKLHGLSISDCRKLKNSLGRI